MPGKLISSRLLLLLVAAAIVLVMTLSAVLAFGAVLGAMGDEAGDRVLRWIGAGVGLVLIVDLTCLVLALAIHAVQRPDEPPEEP